jgi:hypothetical protein
LAAAKEAFNEVIRATSRTKGFVKLPEAYVNMGHLGLAKKQYADALRMYELAGRLNNQRDVKVHCAGTVFACCAPALYRKAPCTVRRQDSAWQCLV